jgi:DNA polymerase-3 subunit beta
VKLTAPAVTLAAAGGAVARAVDKKAAAKIQILGSILLAAGGDAVTFTATDMAKMARARCAAEIAEPGVVAVPAERFSKLLGGGLDGDVTITSSDSVATITAGRARYRLPALPADLFPAPLAAGENALELTLNAATAGRLLEQASIAAARDDARHYLTGVFLCTEDDRLTGVATDGYELVRVATDVPAPALPGKAGGIIVPVQAATEIARLAKGGEVKIRVSDKIIEARAASRELVSKLVDGTFPDYRRVVPKPSSRAVECEREALLAALTRARAVAEDPVVRVAWRERELELALPGEAAIDAIAAEIREPGLITVALSRLINLLEALEGERVLLDATDHCSPIRISIVGDDDLLALLMPHVWRET